MDLIKTLHSAIQRVREPRLFATERGYQGQLATQIDRLLDAEPDGIARPLVEQEYQKTAKMHGITLRPDIILHVPFDRGVSPTRQYDNYLVILLKLSANRARANEDFDKLSMMCTTLGYPLGAFVNIASADLWLPHYSKKAEGGFTLHEFAITLHNGQPHIRTTAA